MRRVLVVLGALVLLLSACGRPAPLSTADRADLAASALQNQFYSAGRWRGAGYWQSAQAFWVVLDEYQRTRANSWLTTIAQVYRANSQGTLGNYRAQYVDDEGWWALDWIRAWDLTGNIAYLNTAKSVFTDMASTWGGTCGGGVWWNHSRTYKNAIPNELFLLVAVELHERTPGDKGPGSYLDWAEREATWFEQSGMINARGQVNDGLTASCQNNGGNPWTYNQGVILAGLAELYHVTGDRADLQLAERIANAEVQVTPSDGVLLERGCELSGNCGHDGPLFKGIFIRYLWWLYSYAPLPAYRHLIVQSVSSIWANDRTPLNTFGLHWAGPAPAPVMVAVEPDIAATMALTSTATNLPTPARTGPPVS